METELRYLHSCQRATGNRSENAGQGEELDRARQTNHETARARAIALRPGARRNVEYKCSHRRG